MDLAGRPVTSDPTLDPGLRSVVPVPEGSDFPIQNLPFGVFAPGSGAPRVGVAIGEMVLDLDAAQRAGVLGDLPPGVFSHPALNPFLALGREAWRHTRESVSQLLSTGAPGEFLFQQSAVEMLLPVTIGDYVDFYSSIHHATNVGRLFRPDDPPLHPNWRHLPVGYHGRTSTVVVSGTPVRRPRGQVGPGAFGPTAKLDFELEVGFVVGAGNGDGHPIPVDDAESHIFGVCLVNDWSARDIQAWEYQPLGPFLGKSFATSVSPWIVTLDALAPFRVPAPPQDPRPLPHLVPSQAATLDLDLQVSLGGTVLARPRFASTYWTVAQQLAHATSNGAVVRRGDLFASGTVSDEQEPGSLLELSMNGATAVPLDDGSVRTFLEDGDEVSMSGRCERPGMVGIGFGECTGVVLAAKET